MNIFRNQASYLVSRPNHLSSKQFDYIHHTYTKSLGKREAFSYILKQLAL